MIVIRRSSGIEAETPNGFKVFRSCVNQDGKDKFKFRDGFGELLSVRFVGKGNIGAVVIGDASSRDRWMPSISGDVAKDMSF